MEYITLTYSNYIWVCGFAVIGWLLAVVFFICAILCDKDRSRYIKEIKTLRKDLTLYKENYNILVKENKGLYINRRG